MKRLDSQWQFANELRPKMAELYLQLHPSTAMVVGDFCCPEVIFKVWEKRPRSSIIFSGFACQPYSRGGKQLGVEDQRASTLRASLTGCFMLRCPVLILECVKEASSNMYVQTGNQQFLFPMWIPSIRTCFINGRLLAWFVEKDGGLYLLPL